ncbi:MAG: hypothetical protein JO181_22345 [Solirubrobacterales bacterium]|nr:hypothetical protein [Solirubrobacterales bacterium]
MSNGEHWVGIDLHRRRSQVAIIDDLGELTLSRRIVNDCDMFPELQPARRRRVVGLRLKWPEKLSASSRTAG